MAALMTRQADRGRHVPLDLQGAVFFQALPRQVQQVGDTYVLEHLEGQCAGMQQGGDTGQGGDHVRNDAQCAAERRDDAAPGAACQSGRDGIDHAGPGRHDHDQRGDKELDAHWRLQTAARHLPGAGHCARNDPD